MSASDPSRPSPGPAANSPLSEAELQRLDSTVLPALERHHLRLLAHALRTLQQVHQSQLQCEAQAHGPGLPTRAAIEAWLQQHPMLNNDAGFSAELAEQLDVAGRQLQALAEAQGTNALQLQLEDLIRWVQAQANRRLANAPPAPPQEPPDQPPTEP